MNQNKAAPDSSKNQTQKVIPFLYTYNTALNITKYKDSEEDLTL